MSTSVDDLLARQRLCWQQGNAKLVEEYLQEHPHLASSQELLVDLVYQEFLLRSDLGHAPTLDEYAVRFPSLQIPLMQQVTFWRVLQEISKEKPGDFEESGQLNETSNWPLLDNYDIQGELGRGAMGIVYRARQNILQRLVAVKMLHPGTSGAAQNRRRFLDEARKLARLRHPNIVQIYEVGEQHGRPYFVMELVEGCSLAQRVAGACLTNIQAARLVETLARTIHHAHENGIVHRDLKPGNILLAGDRDTPIDQSSPKIADFGLAKQLNTTEQSASGMVVGTPCYMAPEQAESSVHSARPSVDIYALGAILYELLAGRPPFQANSLVQIIKEMREREPEPPSRWNAGIDRDLEIIVLKCLHKEPERRYRTALELADDLRRFQSREPIFARPVSMLERGMFWCRRRPVPATLLAALVLTLLASLYFWHEAAVGKQLAITERIETNAARIQADGHVQLLLQLLTSNLQVTGSNFLQKPGGQMICQDLLDNAESACARLWEQRSDDPRVQQLQAMVWTSQGAYLSRRWNYGRAATLLEKALSLWDNLPPELTSNQQNRWGRICTLWELGSAYSKHGCKTEALKMFQQVQQRCREIGAHDPQSEVRAVEAMAGLEMVFQRGESPSASKARQQFESLRSQLQPFIQGEHPNPMILSMLGAGCEQFATGPADPLLREAIERYELAYQQVQKKVFADQNDPDHRNHLYGLAASLARLYLKTGQTERAEQAWKRQMNIRESLLRLHPDMLKNETEYHRDLFELVRLNASAQHRQDFLNVAGLASKALAKCPDEVMQDADFYRSFYILLAGQLRQFGAKAEALEITEQFLSRFERLVQKHPQNPHYGLVLSHAWHWLSKAQHDMQQPQKSFASLEQALNVQRRVVALQPESIIYRERLGELLLRLARKQCELDHLPDAKQLLTERRLLWNGDAEDAFKVQGELNRWIEELNRPTQSANDSPESRCYQELRDWVASIQY